MRQDEGSSNVNLVPLKRGPLTAIQDLVLSVYHSSALPYLRPLRKAKFFCFGIAHGSALRPLAPIPV